MTSSSGTNRTAYAPVVGARRRPGRSRGSDGGTLTRAKCSLPVFGLTRVTARFSDRPEMYGNGCAGSTASGVSTGKIWSGNSSCSGSRSLLAEVGPTRTIVMPCSASAGRTSPLEHAGVLRMQLVRDPRDLLQHLARFEPGGGAHGEAGRDPALETGDADHEELVEVAGEDREEPGPLEQRHVFVHGQLQDALVELQPGDLPLEEPVGRQLVRRPDEPAVRRPRPVPPGCRDGARERARALPSAPSSNASRSSRTAARSDSSVLMTSSFHLEVNWRQRTGPARRTCGPPTAS